MITLALANQKGGVAKSTTAVNVAAILALEHGRRVLLADLDPQANATTGLGVDPARLSVSVYDVLHNPRRIGEAIMPTAWPGLDLLPSNIDLAAAELELAARPGREARLRLALGDLDAGAYDYVVIDTPPSLSIFTQSALMCARWVIAPAEASTYSLHALRQLRELVNLIQPFNERLAVLGVLLTRVDRRTNFAADVETLLRQQLGPLVYAATVPANVKAAESAAAGQPLIIYAPDSSSAQAYRRVVTETLYRIEATNEQA